MSKANKLSSSHNIYNSLALATPSMAIFEVYFLTRLVKNLLFNTFVSPRGLNIRLYQFITRRTSKDSNLIIFKNLTNLKIIYSGVNIYLYISIFHKGKKELNILYFFKYEVYCT